jgi:hypothetical protein
MPNKFYEPFHFADLKEIKEVAKRTNEKFGSFASSVDNIEGISELVRKYSLPLGRIASNHFGIGGRVSSVQWADAGMQFVRFLSDNGITKVKKLSGSMFWWSGCYNWFLPLSCFATDPEPARRAFSNFLQEDLEVEKVPTPIDPAIGKLQLIIASTFRDKPFDVEALHKAAAKSRKKRTKALLSAWDALQEENTEQFQKSIEIGVKEHADQETPTSALVTIAAFETALVCLAYERGWEEIKFPFETACRLVTRKSAGIDK